VPWSELACCRVGWDGVLRAVRLNSATLRLPPEPVARVCYQMACLHGMVNWCSTCRSGEAYAPGWRHIVWTASWSETETARANKQVVGGEAETPRASRRLLVQDGVSSCEAVRQ
jgi:hypothetical protein